MGAIKNMFWLQTTFVLSFVSQYTEDVALKIEHIQINLSKIILLDEIGKENLLNFSSSGIDGIDFSAYLTEVRLHSTTDKTGTKHAIKCLFTSGQNSKICLCMKHHVLGDCTS